MSGIMSKRQQVRNERALQDLVQNVPGNNLCADCGARNPSWASWNLGIFLCMRCAAIHRKMGTHISKVKSLSMDSWSVEQVESMKQTGNILSNKKYNPTNKKAPVPVDADEADSAMERYIRSKYNESQARSTTVPRMNGAMRHNTGSSDEGTPPPLPPKTGGRFFKSGALSFRSKKDSRSPRDSHFAEHDLPSPRTSSRGFGASVQRDPGADETAAMLAKLREMGFMDDKRNEMVLKGVQGNLEKTVEALVRLGEGGGGISPTVSNLRQQPSRSLTPKTSRSLLSSMSKPSPPLPVQTPTSPKDDPWDIPPAQPQSSQSTGTLQNKNPFYNNTNINGTNPFGMQPTQHTDYNLNQSLQNLSLAPSQPPLFPNRTGGSPMSQPIAQQMYAQSMTPPVPQTQNFTPISFQSSQTYPGLSPQGNAQNYNPFVQTPATPQQPLSLNTSPYQTPQAPFANNPFVRSPTAMGSPMLNQIPEQAQQNVYNSPQTPFGSNPFMSQQTQVPQPVLQQQQQQQWYQNQQLGQVAAQPTFQQFDQQQNYHLQKPDTASIMALYNYPNLAPPRMQSPQQAAPNVFDPTPAPVHPQAQAAPPPASSNNPFMSNTIPTANQAAASSARSRESMMLGMQLSWNNGRHSPDAFASLSARSG
ncbi:hypothetical protein F5Y16DRAFT_125377 [Xylariaceae sp. FL0255]|nr:hypothetical protein F5Y16DRAFT_125377 [Xylariaceae sp. FL0255]